MEPHSQFINVDGVRLHVADWGGSGPDLLLLHAGGFLGWVYRAIIARLVTHYHIMTMDLRGHGDSDNLLRKISTGVTWPKMWKE